MRSLVAESFKSNLVILRILGLYPCKDNEKLYKVYAYFLYFSLTVPLPLLAISEVFLDENMDMVKFSDNMFIMFQLSSFIPKLLTIIRRSDQVRTLIYAFDDPTFQKGSNKRHEKILDDCVSTCNTNFRIFFVMCFVSLVSWAAKPPLMHLYKLPVDLWLPYDFKASSLRYCLSYAYAVLSVTHGAISNSALDPLVAGLACQLTGQIKILKDNLKNLSEDADDLLNLTQKSEKIENTDLVKKNELIWQKVNECATHHNAILKYVKDYENVFSQVVFCQFIASVLVICITCYDLTLIAPLSFSFCATMIFLNTLFAEIFLYCYYGTTLYEESDSISTAIYEGKWYDYDMKTKKALILIMESAKRPIIITAGKVLDLSLVTFTTIIRRAYSFFAVLRNMNQ